MDITITTYGGGQILYQIFTALAKLSSKSGGILYPLLTIFSVIGLFIAISRTFFSQSPDYFFKKYFVPIFLTSYVILLPTTNVYIEDLIKQEGFSVSGVPYVLAKSASVISSVGYQITKAFELALHTPNDNNYNSTSMIFGADTQIDSKTFKIRNSDLEYNLKSFCKNCVLYDLALNKYSFDELKKSGDIWDFLEHRTSKSRMINFYNLKALPGKKEADTYVTCQKALQLLKPIFRNEIDYFSKQEIIKNLPLRYQALTGTQMDTDNIISQQIMFGVLKDGLKGSKFAESRAYVQQKSNYQVIGSLAGTSLVTMRAIFEALIYMSFIFVAPLALMPGGYVFIKNWLFMAGWIQLWPPFYAILNFMMYIVSKERASSIIVSGAKTLCYVDQMGLDNFYEDVNAMAGYLMMSVPFISYAIIKGGVQSLIHMAGSLMSPVQSAATSAANEMTSGNYNYGNISYGNNSLGNATNLQRNTAPSLTHGFIQENRGSYSETYGQECILDQKTSNLRNSIISEESMSKSFNESFQNATSLSESSQKMYQESLSAHGRNSCDLINTLANSENYTSNISNSERDDYVTSARNCQNIAKNLSQQTGIDENQSFQFLCSGGINAGICGASMSKTQSAALHQAMNSSGFASVNKDFQASYQKIQDFSSTRAHNSMNEEGIRKSDAFTQSLDDVRSSSEHHQANLSNLSQVSEQMSIFQNNSDRLSKNLNQDFMDFASQRYGSFSRASDIVRKGPECEKQNLYKDFFDYQIEKYKIPMQSAEGFADKYNAAKVTRLDKGSEEIKLHRQSANLESSDKLIRGEVGDMKLGMESEKDRFLNYTTSKSNGIRQNMSGQLTNIKNKMASESSHSLQRKVADSSCNNISSAINSCLESVGINQKLPMWSRKED